MGSLNVKDCMTKAQETALKRDIRSYVRSEIMNAASDEAYKIATAWMKENKEFVKDAIAGAMEKQVIAATRRLIVQDRGY